MKKIVAAILTAVMLFTLAACGGTKDDPNVGVYKGVSVELMGEQVPMEEIYELGENSLELKSGGSGTLTMDGDPISAKWKVDGESLTVTADGVDLTGTIKDGVIELDLMGMLMTFEK